MKKRLLLILYLVIAISFLALSYLNFEYYLTGDASNYSIYIIILLFILAFEFCHISKLPIERDDIFYSIIVFSVVSLITQLPTFLNASFNAAIRNMLHTLAIPMGYILGQNFISAKEFFVTRHGDVLTFLLVIPIFYISYRYLITIFVDPDSLFFIILLLPLTLCVRSDLLKIAAFVFVGICCAISAKRSIIIAYAISMMLFTLHYTAFNRSEKKTKRILLLAVLIVTSCMFISNNTGIIDNILIRFQGLREDDGSGRTNIYESLLKAFKVSSPINQLFGHGYRSAITVLDGVPAHNDFLEILYDFGVIPLILYINILVKIVKQSIISLKKYSLNIASLMLIISVLNLVILGAFNNIFIDTLFVFSCFLCLGIAVRRVKLNSKQK